MKTALEILYKYTPDSTARAILEKAQNPMVRADKENRALQMELDFPRLVEKDELYRIEEEVAKAYDLRYVKFLPHYPAELFSADYVPELLKETERVGVVARGFFGKYRYELKEDTLIIRIPFSEAAIRLIRDARTPEIMGVILHSEFGLDIRVSIEIAEDFSETMMEESQAERLAAMDKQILEADRQYSMSVAERRAAEAQANQPAKPQEQPEILPRVQSLFGEGSGAVQTPVVENGRVRIGFMDFDISEPEYTVGGQFDIIPTPLAAIDKPMRNIVVLGEVFGFTKEPTRQGDKFNITFDITDNSASIEVRCTATPEDADEICKVVSNGAVVAMRGYTKREMRRDKTTRYYVASRNFELPELKLLVDAVQASKFITHKKSNELIKKLEGFASRYEAHQLQRDVFVSNRVKTISNGKSKLAAQGETEEAHKLNRRDEFIAVKLLK